MDYDDFSLSSNFEKMASEYYSALEKKGFVFIRLDDAAKQKQRLAEKTLELLVQDFSMLSSIGRFQTKKINDLKNLTQEQINQMTNLYHLTKPQSTNKRPANFESIISMEASVLKAFFELYNLEDDEAKHASIKSMINARLDLLAN